MYADTEVIFKNIISRKKLVIILALIVTLTLKMKNWNRLKCMKYADLLKNWCTATMVSIIYLFAFTETKIYLPFTI